jgi:hypothetical protein
MLLENMQETIHLERSSPARQDPNLVGLFEAVVDVFALFMTGLGDEDNDETLLDPSTLQLRRYTGFKYCPTPGCSADKVGC